MAAMKRTVLVLSVLWVLAGTAPTSAAMLHGGKYAALLHPGPIPRGEDWLNRVNQPQSEAELAALRKFIARGAPYGSEIWQQATAERLGLEASLRPRGRPRIIKEK